jgi:anaerobic magnesium-protoporphyrin IX monomethyl ester cyclase
MFNVLCTGDGELAILRAVERDGPAPVDGDDSRGAFFLDDAAYESMPSPARHLADLSSDKYWVDGLRATTLVAQVGSPFSCGGCI